MAVLLMVLYLIIMILFVIASAMIIYHIWFYYLNKALAIFTIAIFVLVDLILFSMNLGFLAKIDLNALNLII